MAERIDGPPVELCPIPNPPEGLIETERTVITSYSIHYTKLYEPTATGAQVKLSQVASLELTRGIKSIDHYDLDRYVSVLADVDESSYNFV